MLRSKRVTALPPPPPPPPPQPRFYTYTGYFKQELKQ